jgi:hypothetical protein
MAIILEPTPGAMKLFRRTVAQFNHQRSFATPLKKLPPFVAAVLAGIGPVQAACLVVDHSSDSECSTLTPLEADGWSK